jgi:predicted glycosyl hydrolase (DUF1957 family)
MEQQKTIHRTTQKQYIEQHKKQYVEQHKKCIEQHKKQYIEQHKKQYIEHKKQYIEQHKNKLEQCGPCPILVSYTLAFSLQLRKSTEKPQSW